MFERKNNLYQNSNRHLRSGWWILILLLVLPLLLIPVILLAAQTGKEVPIGLQAILITVISLICQLMLRRPIAELLGKINLNWFRNLNLGGLVGTLLILIPTLILSTLGLVSWQRNPAGFPILASGTLVFIGVAVAEELLFRGFIFQRLLNGIGQWLAQLVDAVFF